MTKGDRLWASIHVGSAGPRAVSALRSRGTGRALSGTRKGGVLGRGPLCREVTPPGNARPSISC